MPDSAKIGKPAVSFGTAHSDVSKWPKLMSPTPKSAVLEVRELQAKSAERLAARSALPGLAEQIIALLGQGEFKLGEKTALGTQLWPSASRSAPLPSRSG